MGKYQFYKIELRVIESLLIDEIEFNKKKELIPLLKKIRKYLNK